MNKNNKNKKKFVWSDTISRKVKGGFSNPNQTDVFKIGGKNILLQRGEKLDRYGNPIHTATIIEKDGTLGPKARTNGNASLAVEDVLIKSGIEVKYKTPWYLKKINKCESKTKTRK